MTTLILKINEQTKAGKAVLSMLNFFTTEKNGIEAIETNLDKSKDEEYNPEFVKMVLNASKSKNRTIVNSKNLWQSI